MVLENEIKTLEESLSQANTSGKTDEPSIVEKLREEAFFLTKDFGKFKYFNYASKTQSTPPPW